MAIFKGIQLFEIGIEDKSSIPFFYGLMWECTRANISSPGTILISNAIFSPPCFVSSASWTFIFLSHLYFSHHKNNGVEMEVHIAIYWQYVKQIRVPILAPHPLLLLIIKVFQKLINKWKKWCLGIDFT